MASDYTTSQTSRLPFCHFVLQCSISVLYLIQNITQKQRLIFSYKYYYNCLVYVFGKPNSAKQIMFLACFSLNVIF